VSEEVKNSELVKTSETEEAKDVSGVVVDASGEEIEVAGHLFKPIVLSLTKGTKIIKLSQRERRFIARLMGTQNLELACKEIGIELTAGRRFLNRHGVKLYLEEKLREAALSNDTTIANNIAWLRRVRDGEEVANKEQLDAAKTLARIHKPASKGINVQVAQINNSAETAVPNPYSEMDSATLYSQTKEALDVIDSRPGTTP